MATIATMPAKEVRPAESSAPAPELALTLAPAPARGMAAIEQHPDWLLLQRLPLRLTAAIPLPSFRVRDLVALKVGHIVPSMWANSDDVPLKIGEVHLSWSEFEVVEQRMAVRLTRLA